MAAKNGNKDVVQKLIDKYKEKNTKEEVQTFLDAVNKYGLTPLIFAAKNGHADVVKLLIEAGATKDKGSNWRFERKVRPMMWAAKYGHADVVKLLIDLGADWRAMDG